MQSRPAALISVALDYVDILLPAITKFINLSLTSGQFEEEWKCALISPLLKKFGLDLLFPNYRPVSNLQYISKLTEKAVFNQMLLFGPTAVYHLLIQALQGHQGSVTRSTLSYADDTQ